MPYKILIGGFLALGLFACKGNPHPHSPSPNSNTPDANKTPDNSNRTAFLSVVQKLPAATTIKDLVEGNTQGLKICKNELIEAQTPKDFFVKNACVLLAKFEKSDIIFVLGAGIAEDNLTKSSLLAINKSGDILSSIDVKVAYKDTLPLADNTLTNNPTAAATTLTNNPTAAATTTMRGKSTEGSIVVENMLSTKVTKEEVFFLQTDVTETQHKAAPSTHVEIQKVRFNYETNAFEEVK
jgi:hypothetical protein